MDSQPSMTQAWYNIVVIGSDLAGLMYAALAARLGYRVAVVGHGARPNTYRRGGFTFLRQPERFLGLSSSPAVARVMSELSLGIEMKNRPQMIDPTLQLVLPGIRLDLAGNRRHWERELERELPGALGAFDAFEGWARAATDTSDPLLAGELPYPPSGLRERAAYRRVTREGQGLLDAGGSPALDALSSDPRLEALALGPLSHLRGVSGGAECEPGSLLPLARLWTHLRSGLYRVSGGLDGLKTLFIRKIREQSSDYRPDEAVSGLVMRRGKVRAVMLADRREMLGCELVVGNLEARRFLQLIPRDQRQDGYHATMNGLEPAGWRLVMNLGVDPRVIPRGMGHEVVAVADPSEPLLGANCLWISRPPSVQGHAGPSQGALQVSALLRSRGAAPTLSSAERLVDASLTEVRRLIPWLDDYLQLIDVPALRTARDGEAPSLDLEELHPVFVRATPGTLGASPFAPTTSYRNVLLGGDQGFSGLGFEGVCAAALRTLALTRRLVRLKTSLSHERHLG